MPTRLIGTDSDDPWLPDVVKVPAVSTKVDDVDGNFTAGDVEGALAEIVDLVDTIVITGGAMPAASDAETIAGTVNDKAVTPAGLHSTYATNAETIAGTETSKAVSPATLKAQAPMVDARTFGVVGNGTTDDTAALQAWATYIANNHRVGYLPNGTYKITDSIKFPTINSWSVEGESRSFTIIKQYTDNTACFRLGDHVANPSSQIMHSVTIRNIHFTHNTAQLSTATSSVGVAFDVMVYHSWFEMLQFSNLGWGMRAMQTTEYSPWGSNWNDLMFGSMAIGAIDLATGGGATPNNVFGRMTINCGTAIGPMLDIQGYNFHVQVLEFLAVNNQCLMLLSGGAQATIESMKIELATYTVTKNIFQFLGSCQIDIGYLFVGGTYADFNPASGGVYLVNAGSGATVPAGWSVRIGTVNVAATSVSGTGAFVFGGVLAAGASGGCEIDHVIMSGGWQLAYNAGTTSNEIIRVASWQNNRLSANKGDANYTVTIGDPNLAHFNTAFTAARTITLPAKAGNNLFTGLAYTFIFDGAIAGANTAIIKEGANTLRTQTTDKAVITYTWRRSIWVMTDYRTLP